MSNTKPHGFFNPYLSGDYSRGIAGLGGLEPPNIGVKVLCLNRLATAHKKPPVGAGGKTKEAFYENFKQRLCLL